VHTVVTGVAGFIGSHLAEVLLAQGHTVTGVDAFTDYYPRPFKEHNLEGLLGDPRFTFVPGDLLALDLKALLKGAAWVFHQAGQAGVRASWGTSFDLYARDNILATQRLLEAAKDASLQKFVYASSSSVYGDAEAFPTPETTLPKPVSPYGVTKLAGEHLCHLYWRNYGVPTIALRYFTVYGPRQRPDMAFHTFGRSLLTGIPIQVYGDGLQTRDFTYISDALQANLLAAERGAPGEVFNIGGGSRVTVKDVLKLMETTAGMHVEVHYQAAQHGDARHTSADIAKARRLLNYTPRVGIREGIKAEVDWLKQVLAWYPQIPGAISNQ